MENRLYERPILNSPYECPDRRWELDAEGQPTQEIIPTRRKSSFITPIPKPQKRKAAGQTQLAFDEGKGLSTVDQVYSANEIINQIRDYVTEWRQLPDPTKLNVTLEMQSPLEHWRHRQFSNPRPFFCQIEAAGTVIWLTEASPAIPGRFTAGCGRTYSHEPVARIAYGMASRPRGKAKTGGRSDGKSRHRDNRSNCRAECDSQLQRTPSQDQCACGHGQDNDSAAAC
jgi:hypothetical protein